MAGELGKASLDLEANLGPFERNVATADATSDRLKDTLEALAAVADAAQSALNDVKMGPAQGVRSKITAEEILSGVRGVSEESRIAARELDRVHLGQAQVTETDVAGDLIDHKLDEIKHNAERTSHALDRVRLRLAAAAGRGGGSNRPGYGVGPFGAGYGRLGVFGTAVGLGALTVPAAVPAAVGLLAGIPTMAAAGAGALGTLALAFSGVGKAISGDKKAFDGLTAAQQKFVLTVRSLDNFSDRLKQIAAQSVFPGLTKGLKAALSPGTVNAIETALVQLGRAIGGAGEQWGKYFGSARFQHIFGPLMQSAARNIGVVSGAFLHLFDALGVVARAAIPFTNWVTSMIGKGAKFADTWIRAQDATGRLGTAMGEARTSLTLVIRLAGALLNVVFALGRALYPVAKVAIKLLTDGLNGLAHVIDHNKQMIRDIVRGALAALVTTVKIATPIVKGLAYAIRLLAGFAGGWKNVFLAIIGLGFARIVKGWTGALGKLIGLEGGGAGLLGAEAASGGLLANLTKLAGLGVITVEVLVAMHFIKKYGVRNLIDAAQFGSIGPDISPDSTITVGGKRYIIGTGAAYAALIKAGAKLPAIGKVTARQEIIAAKKLGGTSSIPTPPKPKQHHRHSTDHSTDPKPGTHAWYMKYLGFDPTTMPTFGPPPPFTKNTGGSGSSKQVIPAAATHQLALAATQASIAANAKNLARERQALDREITDLEKADQILIAKWKNAHGKTKTELFNAITATQNKIRSARKKLRDAVGKVGASKLDYALAQTQVAVEKATEGSKAWDTAIAAEEKELKAEIRYWDKVAHNMKLSADARTAALKKELNYQRQLKALLKQTSQAQAANIGQFLQSFVEIQNTFAPNAVPYQTPSGSGKTDTHLHDIKQESREMNRHLRAIRGKARFPSSGAGLDAAMAVTG